MLSFSLTVSNALIIFLFKTVHFVLLSSAKEVVEVKIEPLPVRPVEVTTRIIGGKPTNIEKYPFIVQVTYLDDTLCGGSLITSRHVLSAAHCFDGGTAVKLNLEHYYVRAGTQKLNNGGSTRSTSGLIVHERYNKPYLGNDIAVIMLRSSFIFSEAIGMATLPTPGSQLEDNTTVWHVGWGTETVFRGTPFSSLLNEVQVFTINNDACRARYLELEKQLKGSFPVTENNLCSGVLDVGGKDACHGDSGGPLVYAGRFVVGVTAWGYRCALAQYPGVNMKTSAYTDWIQKSISKLNASPDTKASADLLFTLIFTVIFINKM